VARAWLAALKDPARRSHPPDVRLGVRRSLPRNVDLSQRWGSTRRRVHPDPEGGHLGLLAMVAGVPEPGPG
jgi:hypothetical protein